jgi:hypothetical protein
LALVTVPEALDPAGITVRSLATTGAAKEASKRSPTLFLSELTD